MTLSGKQILLAIVLFFCMFTTSTLVIGSFVYLMTTDDPRTEAKKESELIVEQEKEYKPDTPESISCDSMIIPGYQNLLVSRDKPCVKLNNPEGNTVYLEYILTEDDEVIYTTNAIKPGCMVEANLKQKLDKGMHEIIFTINTYDIKTNKPCNGGVQVVNVKVE